MNEHRPGGRSYRVDSEPTPGHVIDWSASNGAPARRFSSDLWRLFFLARVSVLLTILGLLCFWAVDDAWGRSSRLEWNKPLDVALVLTAERPIEPATLQAFRERVRDLERHLQKEMARYRRADMPPIRFYVYGPVTVPPPPPPLDSGGLLDEVIDGFGRRVYAAKVNRQAQTPLVGFDSHIYIAANAPSSTPLSFVEGFSEQGGRLGFVSVQLDLTMIDFALFVTTHELFHTLGASDKYVGSGRTVVPGGLVEPTRVPLYPQPSADVMAHGRPLSPVLDAPPSELEQLGIGPATAREVRWVDFSGER